MPRVSVILPVFNAEKYVSEAVSSILNQTVRDIEIIAIDDGSTDGSRCILEKLADSDCRIKLISRENIGLSATLNEGVAISTGEWIARMDADDISHPDRFEKQLNCVLASGADLCGSAIRTFGSRFSRKITYPETTKQIRTRLLFNSAFAHPSVFGRASLFRKFKYTEAGMPAEDYDLWTRIAAAGTPMTNCLDVLLDYRIHANQISTVRRLKQIEVRRRVAKQYWKSNNILDLYVDCFEVENEESWTKLKRYEEISKRMDIDECVYIDSLFQIAIRSTNIGKFLCRDAFEKNNPLSFRQKFAILVAHGFGHAFGINFYEQAKSRGLL